MIALDNVTISFGKRILFRELNYHFAAGKITVIRKSDLLDGGSTLLKCCAGIITPSEGVVRFGQKDLVKMSPQELYHSLCYCHEAGGLVSLFTVYNNLAIPLQYHQVFTEEEIHERIVQVADRLGITPLLELEPFQLNDVQVRLVNLARALVVDANVILIDELQTGMSATMLSHVIDLLQTMAKQGVSILMVTTSGHEESFADQQLIIRNNQLESLM